MAIKIGMLVTYCHYHSPYHNKTWQDGELPEGAYSHKAKGTFDHVVLQNHVTN